MNSVELKEKISAFMPSVNYEEGGEFVTVMVPNESLYALMSELRNASEFNFDYLFCLTCIDWKDHLMMVYYLLSKTHRHSIVVKTKIADCEHPTIASLTAIWPTAELNEREVFDLFGVQFTNHPDLRRIFLTEDWKGFPLRKNYTDENMIEL